MPTVGTEDPTTEAEDASPWSPDRAQAAGVTSLPRRPRGKGRSSRVPRRPFPRLGAARRRRSRVDGRRMAPRTQARPRWAPTSKSRARGAGGGGAPALGRAAPRTADGGTGSRGTATMETRGPDGTAVATGFSQVVTAGSAAAGVAGPNRPNTQRLSGEPSRRRSGSRSLSPTRPTRTTRSSAALAPGRGGCAAPSAPTRRSATPGTR